MTSHVAVINESTVQLPFSMHDMVKALQHKASVLRKLGYQISGSVDGYDNLDRVPRGSTPLIITDDSDQAGALGYHDQTEDGKPIAYVFAKTTMEAGLELSVTVDHEYTEMEIDERARLIWDLGGGIGLAYETCDQVEADEYGFDFHGIRLSDTVAPEWFEESARGPYDWTHQLASPLTLMPGGYIGVYEDGTWSQVYSEHPSPGPISRAKFAKRILKRRDTPVMGLRTY